MSSPNSTFVQMFANERSTTAALLISVLVRIINKTDRFGSNAVALFNFNTHCMDHVPDQLLKQISTITLLNYDSSPLIKDTFERPNFFLHIHGYKVAANEQVIWPFALDLWALSGGLAAFYVWYLLVLAPHLRQHRRDMYDLVNTPLHIFRIVLLFLLTEYYTALLTSSLGLSQVPFYPTTIQEFVKTPTPLLVLRRDLISILQENKDFARKMIFYENIEQYQHGQYALTQLCDMFMYTIGSITKYLGKEMSYRHYHLIDEPFTTTVTMVPFGKLNPRLKRFQMYVNRLNEAGIWTYLVKKWNLKASGTQVVYEPDDVDALFLSLEHFVPRTETKAIHYAPILVHAFGISKPNGPSEESPIQSEVLNILEYFKLIEKTKNIIVLLDAYGVKPTELDLLAKTYHHFGAIDIIYVLLKMKEPIVIRLNDMSTEFVKLSTFARIEQLFPDRLANMSGRPYKVACLENPPLSFRSPATNRTIGIDVEFIDMIAKHQHTVADYRYTAQPIELFEPWHSTEIDFATYRIILTEQAYKFALLFLPNQNLWCLAVPKTYNRILHQQILWPYTTDMWLLIGTIVICFLLIDLRQDGCQLQSLNTPIVIHAVTSFQWMKNKLYILKDVLDTLQHFGLYGKSKKLIVLIDMNRVTMAELKVLKESYQHAGAIDILYVLEHSNFNQLNIMIPTRHNRTTLVHRSAESSIEQLFPDRLSNQSGQPYKVACIENRPLTYRDASSGRIIGIDVDFIDIIAKHQRTVAQFKHTADPIKQFKSWYDVEFDMATYRVPDGGLAYPFAPLYFPNQFRWCLAVPKTYDRVIHDQVIWPYQPPLWAMILSLAAFLIVYRLFLRQPIQHQYPDVFPAIDTPLQLLRMLLLFLMTEYYTAKLTAILGLSEVPIYPRTLAEFSSSPIPLLASHRSGYQYLIDNPQVHAKTIEWNFSAQYDPTGMALLQLCDLFPFTIGDTTQIMGKRLSHHHYHLIDEPISTSICISPFRKTSPRLVRFQQYVTRLNEAGIWDQLVSKWMLKDGRVSVAHGADKRTSFRSSILELFHFVPVYVIGGYLYTSALIIFILEHLVYRLQQRF
ncbi:AGAP006440-PA [Anopheles gambiae str. PEST]|uniref:AGAP006440-PA n=1 Tax=Anopheles gambiae TaxID=7165 RepID=A7UU96_ANOGA|nr:AGAP006440-PA [Anopheles gambiae str. PEST]